MEFFFYVHEERCNKGRVVKERRSKVSSSCVFERQVIPDAIAMGITRVSLIDRILAELT